MPDRMHGRKVNALIAAWLVAGSAVWAGRACAGADIAGVVHAPLARHRADAVVYIEHVDGEFAPPAEHAVMDQRNLRFVPRVLPILAGTTVDFRNSDNVLHNVFTPDDCGTRFNLGSWPRGEVRSHRFDDTDCPAVMLCNVHPEMEAYILVLQNPWFARTGPDGKWRIPDVPPGSYRLRVWHSRLAADPVEITVPDSGLVEVTFDLERPGSAPPAFFDRADPR
jgi:plastocyanin